MKNLADKKGFAIDHTEDSSVFTPENLRKYTAVMFLSTSGNVFNEEQERAFENYIKSGGGFVGIHLATGTEYDWEWYGKMVGARFVDHPKVQPAQLLTVRDHPATKHLPETWEITDEWYNFRDIQTGIQPLLMLDEKSYTGGKNGDYHPASWIHEYDGGKIFYTVLGHREETYGDDKFLHHIYEGIKYSSGL